MLQVKISEARNYGSTPMMLSWEAYDVMLQQLIIPAHVA